MKNIIAAAVLALAAGAMAWAAPEASRNDKFGIQVTFPEKWIVGAGDEPLLLMSRSTDLVSMANCVAIGEAVAGTRAMTQEQINTGMTTPFGQDFWRQVYASAGLTAEVKTHGARKHKSGLTIQEAEFELGKPETAPDNKMTVHQAIFVRPGLTVTLACGARTALYGKHKSTLTAVIESVRFYPPAAPVAAVDAPVAVAVKDGGVSPSNPKESAGDPARAGIALIDLSK
jgi:hypothetical protein